jgi:hypothetical protein
MGFGVIACRRELGSLAGLLARGSAATERRLSRFCGVGSSSDDQRQRRRDEGASVGKSDFYGQCPLAGRHGVTEGGFVAGGADEQWYSYGALVAEREFH